MSNNNETISPQDMSPMGRLIAFTGGDADVIADITAGVLEYLTVRAVIDAPYVISGEGSRAMVLIAANEDVDAIRSVLPSNVKNWEDEMSEEAIEKAAEMFIYDDEDEEESEENIVADAMNNDPEQQEWEQQQ